MYVQCMHELHGWAQLYKCIRCPNVKWKMQCDDSSQFADLLHGLLHHLLDALVVKGSIRKLAHTQTERWKPDSEQYLNIFLRVVFLRKNSRTQVQQKKSDQN